MKYLSKILIGLAFLICLCLSVVVPKFVILISIFCLSVIFIIKNPVDFLGIYIVAIPFAATGLLAQPLPFSAGLTVLYAFILLITVILAIFKIPISFPQFDINILSILIVIITIFESFMSTSYAREVLPYQELYYWDYKGYMFWVSYFIKTFIIPVVQFLPFILIMGLLRSEKDILKIKLF